GVNVQFAGLQRKRRRRVVLRDLAVRFDQADQAAYRVPDLEPRRRPVVVDVVAPLFDGDVFLTHVLQHDFGDDLLADLGPRPPQPQPEPQPAGLRAPLVRQWNGVPNEFRLAAPRWVGDHLGNVPLV